MITIKNLSNGQEDCFLIEIKRDSLPTINILLDGGLSSKRLEASLEEKIDYLVVTHIDKDHIAGVLNLLNKNNEKFKDTIIVYNKFTTGVISYKQAEKFEKLIGSREIVVSYKEYQQSLGDVEFLSTDQRRKLNKKESEVYITFLSPDKAKVESLYNGYLYYKKHGKLISSNNKMVNKSSIIFLLEYQEKSILMCGDGYISDIIHNIAILNNENCFYKLEKIDIVKLPHHGSEENNKHLDVLFEKTKCEKFIITNGAKGNVNIGRELVNNLNSKLVYVSEKIEKYKDLNISVSQTIKI